MSFDISVRTTVGDCTIDAQLQSDAKLIAIVGKSGVGKTTLLNCIAGLLQPNEGRIAINGQTLFDSQQGIDVPSNRRRCGYVFQDSRLFPHKTVEENMAYGSARGIEPSGLSFDDVTALLDIDGLLKRSPKKLSGGETRRVAIGRALLSNPDFLLFDEPLSSLDPGRTETILATIERLRDEMSIPMLYVSHDEAEVTRLTDTVITLD